MPARSIAAVTASATLSTMPVRPISSGRIGSLIAKPTDSRLSSTPATAPWLGVSVASVVAKIVAWGLMTPSVPPDQTIGISLTCSGGAPLSMSASRKARSAMMRV